MISHSTPGIHVIASYDPAVMLDGAVALLLEVQAQTRERWPEYRGPLAIRTWLRRVRPGATQLAAIDSTGVVIGLIAAAPLLSTRETRPYQQMYPDPTELITIHAVHPTWQRNGIGTALVNEVRQVHAARHKATGIVVPGDLQQARTFYSTHNATLIGKGINEHGQSFCAYRFA